MQFDIVMANFIKISKSEEDKKATKNLSWDLQNRTLFQKFGYMCDIDFASCIPPFNHENSFLVIELRTAQVVKYRMN